MFKVAELKERWQGVVIPLVTPFDETGLPNLGALAKNVQWLMDRGAKVGNSVFLAAGSGGDYTSMTTEERKQVIKTVCEVAAGKVPVMASAQSTDIRTCIDLCQFGEEIGLDGMQLSGPYYYAGRPGDTLRWMQQVAKHTSMGFAVYNNWYTGYDMPLTLIDELLDIPNSVAIKWSSPDIFVFMDGIRRFGERAAIIDNALLPEIAYPLGVHCHVSHLPNFYPEHSWRVHELFMSGDYVSGKKEWDRCIVPWFELIAPIRAATGGEGVFVRPAMDLVGLTGGHSPLPSRDDVIAPDIRDAYARMIASFHNGH